MIWLLFEMALNRNGGLKHGLFIAKQMKVDSDLSYLFRTRVVLKTKWGWFRVMLSENKSLNLTSFEKK